MFALMAYLVYQTMDIHGVWGWAAPYYFIVTVFHLLSLVFFFISGMILAGLGTMVLGSPPNQIIVGLYNTIVLRMWYMNPYGISDPLTNVQDVLIHFTQNLFAIANELYVNTFLFLYMLSAGVSIVLFLQSLARMEHRFVVGAFVSMQAILILAALRGLIIPGLDPFPTDLIAFLIDNAQILALVSFAYLEISYQMIYSFSVGKPVEDREETLKKQLLALRQATRKQDAIERGEKVSTTGMSRSSGATAFSFLREAIERKVVGSTDALENLDAVADVRRLQIFVDELLHSDPRAKDELTAKAAAPSSSYVIGSTIMGSAIRFLTIVAVSFLLMSPSMLEAMFNLPPGIESSIELLQPEIIIILLVPVIAIFPFAAMAISWMSQREVEEKPKLTKEQKTELKRKKEELKRKKKEAKKAREEREKAKKKREKEGVEERDEWDKALEETFKK